MARKKSTPASTSRWRIVTDTGETDIEASLVSIEDGVLIMRDGGRLVAAWISWRYVTRLVDPPLEASV